MPASLLTTIPSGLQHQISFGNQQALITEVGATLRSYTVDDVDVLDGFDAGEMSSAGRGQILAPWPNRLEDGRYTRYGKEGRAALKLGKNLIAVHCHQTTGGQYIDVGLVEEIEE